MSAPRTTAERRRPTRRGPDGSGGPEGGWALTPERARVLVLVAARPATFALTIAAVLVMTTLLAAGSGTEGGAGAIAASWLAIHQVPLTIGKTTLGALPLLATGLLVWGTARECAHAVRPGANRVDLAWILGAALLGPLVVTSICIAVTEDASAVVALQPPNPLAAFALVFFWHLLAAVAGIATRLPDVDLPLPAVPEWVLAGLRAGGLIVVRMLACAAAVVLLALLARGSAVLDAYAGADGVVGVLGLTLLSIGYLPNVVVATVGVLLGPGAQLGGAEFGLFGVVGGAVPGLPVLGAVPTGPAAGWWPVLLVLPAAVGALGGLETARSSEDRLTAPWATLTAAGSATLALLLLGAVSGGQLGEVGRVGMLLPAFAVVALAWFAVFGYAGLVLGRRWNLELRRPRRRRAVAASAPPPAGEYDDYGFDAGGFDRDGYDRDGFDPHGYDREGYDPHGYDSHGYDSDGYDADGYHEDGLHEDGYDAEGFDRHGFDQDGYDADGYHRDEYEDADPDAESDDTGRDDTEYHAAEHAAREDGARRDDAEQGADRRTDAPTPGAVAADGPPPQPRAVIAAPDPAAPDGADDDPEHPGARYLDADAEEPLVAELVDDEEAVVNAKTPPAPGPATAEIVDAEVVDADLPEGGRTPGR
ncbi:DUF6350 family protein [Nocardia sp. NPDC057353]|uniref:cell division protein PerM n=1 Tax=Nocardia sp. NPDC057353 TaxID=3346104 RepID=UPI00363EACBE